IMVPVAQGLTVEGRFERLHWPEKKLVADAGDDSQAQADAGGTPGEPAADPEDAGVTADTDQGQDPATLPPLDFQVRDLRVGQLVLGEAQFKAHPVPRGLRIDTFSTRSDGYQLDAKGDWLG